MGAPASDFVVCSHTHPRYFETGAGVPFVPIGLNLCFPRFFTSEDDGLASMRRWLDRLADHGGNYARIFLGHPFFEVEHSGFGVFDARRAERLDAVISHAWGRGIRLKLTLEHFRSIGPSAQAEMFRGALDFSRPLYHGPDRFSNMDAFLESPEGKRHFLRKLDWLAARYADHPAIIGWDLWNEMNAVKSEAWVAWTREMLPELKRRFPRHLAMQNLGSLASDRNREAYRQAMPLEGNEIVQAHRYLDLGAPWKICHGPVDAMMADAVEFLRRLVPGKPALLSEGGAVEPRHARPWDIYPRDAEGTVLHDVLFAPFFAGAAGSGNPWHWHEYVDPNDLWHQFGRFARAIEGFDPIAEGAEPDRADSGRLRVYVLKGTTACLAWCRDKDSDWRSEVADGMPAAEIAGETIELPFPQANRVSVYDPWTDRVLHEGPVSGGTISLPPFRRSVVVRLSRS